MKVQAAVKKETIHIATGTVILMALMMVIFALCGRFDSGVIFGSLLGSAYAVLNFFLLGLTVQKATQAGSESRSRNIIQLSYSLRLLAILVYGIIVVNVDAVNWVAAIAPLLFPRIVIFVMSLSAKKQKKED